MKYPNPTFLHKAESVRNKRRRGTLIILASLSFIVLVVVFVLKVAGDQNSYREQFPGLVGAATKETTTIVVARTSRTSETTTETTETEPTAPAPIFAPTSVDPTAGTMLLAGGSNENNSPSPFDDIEPVQFSTNRPAQVVSHQTRAVNLDLLKRKIEAYQRNNPDVRICFRYEALSTSESTGVDDTDIITPSSAYALPVQTIFYELVHSGRVSLSTIYKYVGQSNSGHSSYITSYYRPGKEFYLRTCAYLSIAYNDNLAYNALIDNMGGIGDVTDKIDQISSYQSYGDEVTYTDYKGKEYRGTGRSTCLDMVNYAKYLYNGSINHPEIYQMLINDMSRSKVVSPLTTVFDGSLVLHAAGRNTNLGAYTDVAIIDYHEPIAVCIYVEAASYNRASEAMTEVSTYLKDFITSCYE